MFNSFFIHVGLMLLCFAASYGIFKFSMQFITYVICLMFQKQIAVNGRFMAWERDRALHKLRYLTRNKRRDFIRHVAGDFL